MSTNKKFRIQNGVDIHGGGLSIDDVTVIDADGKVVASAIADAVAGLTSSDIADLQAQVSAILGTSPETLDTLQEIVAAFEAADTTLTGTIAQNAADIATINTTLTNGVATPTDVADLQSQVTANDTDIAANAAAIAAANARTAGISTSSGSSNIQMTADVDMDSNKVTNMADPTAAQDAATKAYVDAASSTSSTDLATETAARIQGDADTLSSAQADATTKADAAEASAVATASADATSKANAAQAAAEATAAADATTKADAAEAAAIAHANSGDATVQAAVDVVSGRVDAILNGAGESLDTIVEVVAAFENADSDIQSLISSNSSSLTSEISRATAAESTLQSNIDAEESARIAADAVLTTSVSDEETARIAGDAALDSDLGVEVAARIAGDASLSSAISTEESARIAADTSLSSDIVSATTLVAGDGISVDNLTHTVSLDGSALEQSLVPAVDNVYTLGSPDKVWKDVYIGPGSLYIGGQKVIEDNSGTITVNADPNQNLTVQTTGTGALNVQSTGSGGVSIDAASESVSIKSNLVMSVDKTISTAGGAATKMGGDVDMQGHSVTGLGAPSAAADAATKSYVDGRIAEGTISGSKTFSDSVIISGDLTVQGTTTTVNSETISLADNIIDLNSNLTSGAPSENAGIRVMRGDASAVQVRWNETSDHWETYNGSAWTKIALDTDDLTEGATNLYFTEARARGCVSADVNSCIDYDESTGKFSLDVAEADGALNPDQAKNADQLDGQHGDYYRINVYNVAGTLVN